MGAWSEDNDRSDPDNHASPKRNSHMTYGGRQLVSFCDYANVVEQMAQCWDQFRESFEPWSNMADPDAYHDTIGAGD